MSVFKSLLLLQCVVCWLLSLLNHFSIFLAVMPCSRLYIRRGEDKKKRKADKEVETIIEPVRPLGAKCAAYHISGSFLHSMFPIVTLRGWHQGVNAWVKKCVSTIQSWMIATQERGKESYGKKVGWLWNSLFVGTLLSWSGITEGNSCFTVTYFLSELKSE